MRSNTSAALSGRLQMECLEARRVLAANVIISEFVASNDSSLDDRDGDSSDWLELFNAGDEAANLAGWHLTDDADDLNKWTFPAVSVEPSEYLVVFASDKDRTNPDSELHTNFKLSSGGEFLALVEPDGRTITQSFDPFPRQFTDIAYGVAASTITSELVSGNSESKVIAAPIAQPNVDWTDPSFNDGTWTTREAAIGFSDGRLDSLLGDNGDISDFATNSSSIYSRIPFQVDAGTNFDELHLEMQYDDGFVAYLNGTAVAARNAPAVLNGQAAAIEEHGGTITTRTLDQLLSNQGLKAVGSGLFTSDRIQLTSSVSFHSGAVWTNEPLSFAPRYSFSAFMELDVTQPGGDSDADGTGGHGMAFVIQSGGPFRLGSAAGGLGLDNSGMPFVAVELDSWSSGSFDPDDSLASHIGINTSVEGSVARAAVPRFNGSNSSNPRFIWVGYDGLTKLMDVYFSDTNQQPSEPALSASVDLESIFQGTPSLWAGWTAANGTDAWNVHEVRDFNIATTAEPVFDAEAFDLSEFTGLLQPGTNVLAIHGLNVSADDNDFLISPALTGVKQNHFDINNAGYLESPTPGEVNSAMTAAPSGDVTFSVTGRTFEEPFDLVITAEVASANIRYTTDGAIPDEDSMLYTGSLRIDESTRIRARAFEPGKAAGPVTSHGYIQLDSELTDYEGDVFDSNLPLMVFHSFGRSVHSSSSRLVPVSTAFFSNDDGRASLLDEPEFAGRAGMRIRGQSSQGWPKKQYALEIWEEGNSDRFSIPANRAEDRAISIFGLPEESDWVLNGPYSDKTQLNNFLTFNWTRAMGLYAPRTRLVEVFVKLNEGALNYRTDYRGTYVLLEKIKIDSNRVDITELTPGITEEPDISGGYIWKYDKDGAGDVNFTTTFQSRTGSTRPWKFVEPQRPPSAQYDWLQGHLNEFESVLYGNDFDDPINGYAKYIDVESWVNTWLMVELTKNVDGFRLSTYYHKDRGGKITQGPAWDFNLSLANANYLQSAFTNGWYHDSLGSRDYPYWDRLFEDPNFEIRVRDRWFELRKTVFATDNLLADVDDAVSRLTDGNPTLGVVAPGQPSNPISRNFARWNTLSSYLWPNCYFGVGGCPASPLPNQAQPNSYEDYIFIQKKFVEDRAAWIDGQFRTPPTIAPAGTLGQAEVVVSLTGTSAGTVYYTLDGSDPRDAITNGISDNAIRYEGSFVITDNRLVQARSRSGSRWSGKATETFIVEVPKLSISEVHYNPADPTNRERVAGFTDKEEFEFLELTNYGISAINVEGMRIASGVEVVLGAAELQPGARAVVVRNEQAFRTRYGNGAQIVGQYGDPNDEAADFKLRNSGEQLLLYGTLGETIADLTYSDAWYPLTDGDGFSLVRREPITEATNSDPLEWRPSGLVGGSPGHGNAIHVPGPGDLVINEIIDDSSGTSPDTIELYNATDADIRVDNYLLTLDALGVKEFRLPSNVVVPGKGYLLVDATTVGADFSISSRGGVVTLRGALANGAPTGFLDLVQYGTAIASRSWSRVETSIGSDFALAASTVGVPNAAPMVGPVVISEIQYHPEEGGREFIELRNTSAETVSLHGWEFDLGVRYRFADVAIASGSSLVLVQADEGMAVEEAIALFRQERQIPLAIPILAYTAAQHGSLANEGETLRLKRPVEGTTAKVEVDRITYSDSSPWISRADGFGPSLSRLSLDAYGNDPANWSSSSQNGSPGRVNVFEDASPPTTPKALSVSILDDGSVGLGWQASFDPDTQVKHYSVFRDGETIGTTSIPFFRDHVRWSEGQTFSYQVNAVNVDDFASGRSNHVDISLNSTSFQEGVDGYTGATDTRLRERDSDNNYGDNQRLVLDGNADGDTGAASSLLFRWGNLEVPDDGRLVSGSISLSIANPGDDFVIRPVLIDWVEAEATWNEASRGRAWQLPGVLGSNDAGAEAMGVLATNRQDIITTQLNEVGTRIVRAWLDDPSSNYGVILDATLNATDGVTLDSSESTTPENRPVLTIFHTSLPEHSVGDVNFDGQFDDHDIDLMHAAIRHGVTDAVFDLDGNSLVDERDVDYLLANIIDTIPGDANLDREVDFADFLLLSTSFGKDGQTWSTGDFDGDGIVDFADFLVIAANFGKRA